MNTSKYVTAVISGDSRFTISDPIMKEDKGLKLKIKGIVFPANYEVDFSTSEKSGESVTMIGDASGVEIPEYLIKTGKDIYAFLYWVGDGYGRTPHTIRIPNKLRPDRTDITPEPAEQSVIDQTIEKLNEAVKHAPRIGDDGMWTVWDAETGEYVSTGQKAQGEQGEKGDTGNSGVYIGEDEPEDEDVGVWIETDGEPDEMPEPLKYVKDAPSDNGAVIEGNVGANTATGRNSHAEGGETTASAENAHAEGGGTTASGQQAHAEGSGTTASGADSHAEGTGSQATNQASHAGGFGTIANKIAQTAIGKFNAKDPDMLNPNGTYVFIVGNGTSDNMRSNAFAVKWDGTFVMADGTEVPPEDIAALASRLDVYFTGENPVFKSKTYAQIVAAINAGKHVTGYRHGSPSVSVKLVHNDYRNVDEVRFVFVEAAYDDTQVHGFAALKVSRITVGPNFNEFVDMAKAIAFES